jgi:cell division protein FtsQ
MSRAAAVRRGLPASMPDVAAQQDKRFRRSDARPGRRRWQKLAWKAGFIGIGCLVALGLVTAAGSAVLHSQALAVSNVVVRGNVRLSTGEVEALVGGLRGQGIFFVNFEEYRKRLMDSPWVGSVTLSRVLPGTVVIQIGERAPMAVARLGQQLYLVDDRGMIIDEFGPQYREFDLPVVDGLVHAAKSGGPSVDMAAVSVSGRFLSAVASRADLRGRVSQIDVSNPQDVVVLLDDDPVLLHVGDTRFVERLEMYLQIAPTLRAQMTDIDYADLRLDDVERIVVRPKSTSAADLSRRRAR